MTNPTYTIQNKRIVFSLAYDPNFMRQLQRQFNNKWHHDKFSNPPTISMPIKWQSEVDEFMRSFLSGTGQTFTPPPPRTAAPKAPRAKRSTATTGTPKRKARMAKTFGPAIGTFEDRTLTIDSMGKEPIDMPALGKVWQVNVGDSVLWLLDEAFAAWERSGDLLPIIDTTSPWRTLGVSMHSTTDEVKKARNTLYKLWHPDKNGQALWAKKATQAVNDAATFLMDDSITAMQARNRMKLAINMAGRGAPPKLLRFTGGGVMKARVASGRPDGRELIVLIDDWNQQ